MELLAFPPVLDAPGDPEQARDLDREGADLLPTTERLEEPLMPGSRVVWESIFRAADALLNGHPVGRSTAEAALRWLRARTDTEVARRAFASGYFAGALAHSRACDPGTVLRELRPDLDTTVSPLAGCLDFASNVLRRRWPPSNELRDQFDALLNRKSIDEVADAAFGVLLSCLWTAIAVPQNAAPAVAYGLAISEAVLAAEGLCEQTRLRLPPPWTVVDACGSGKKKTRLPNITTAAALTAASIFRAASVPIAVIKSGSHATSSISGATDFLSAVGFNAQCPIESMQDVAMRTHFGYVEMPSIARRLARIYDGRTFGITVLSVIGLPGNWNPFRTNGLVYGLTHGPGEVALSVLEHLYPHRRTMVVTGFDRGGVPIIDQFSLLSHTLVWESAAGRPLRREIRPGDVGLMQCTRLLDPRIEATVQGHARLTAALLAGRGPAALTSTVALEAAAILRVAGLVPNLREGVQVALAAIEQGDPLSLLEDFITQAAGDVARLHRVVASSRSVH